MDVSGQVVGWPARARVTRAARAPSGKRDDDEEEEEEAEEEEEEEGPRRLQASLPLRVHVQHRRAPEPSSAALRPCRQIKTR